MRLAACACAAVTLGAASPSTAADPLAANQEWLPRVVAPTLAPPSRPVPAVAVIASGVDLSHPDLAGGWVVERRVAPPPDPSDQAAVQARLDGIARGTAVASIIGAPRDGAGLEGVLPGARVWIYGTDGTCRDAARAIRRAADGGARIIDAGAGFTAAGRCEQLADATTYAFGEGSLIVAAGGDSRSGSALVQPAGDLHVLTAVAVDALGNPAPFSVPAPGADVAAPGQSVFAAIPLSRDLDDGVADAYTRWDGAALSAAMVSAAAAWVLAERPGLSAGQLAEVLRLSARNLGAPGRDAATGSGALDLAAALRRAASPRDSREPDDDIRWVDERSPSGAVAPLLLRTSEATIDGRLDTAKDPRDVHPVRLAAGAEVTIRLSPRGMPMDLYAWQPTALTVVGEGGAVISSSRRRRLGSEVLRILNDGPAGATMWVEVRAVRGEVRRSGGYRLRLSR